MAGRGPRPKHPSARRRTNVPDGQTILRFEVAEQPELPAVDPNQQEWCDRTRGWWEMWGRAAQSEHFSLTDWDFLLDTAVLHQALWHYGDMSVIAELRLRVAKFGATLEDRARLKMQFAEADKAEAKRPPVAPKTPAADPRSVLHAVG